MKMNSEMATRCEIALMGKVVPIRSNDEVQPMTEYIYSALGKEEPLDNILNCINRWNDNDVKYLVCNTVAGMKCVTYLLESPTKDPYSEDWYPAPFTEDYGSGYPSAFCYVFNADQKMFSEFGDCFFEKRTDSFYHKVS